VFEVPIKIQLRTPHKISTNDARWYLYEMTQNPEIPLEVIAESLKCEKGELTTITVSDKEEKLIKKYGRKTVNLFINCAILKESMQREIYGYK